jgi:putative flippase GtrA
MEQQREDELAFSPPVFEPQATFSRVHSVTRTLMQLLRFIMVGGLNTLIDLAIFNAFLWLWPTQNTWLLLLYNSLAYALGGINSFILNKYWTFHQRQKTNSREVIRFVVTTLAGVSCNDFIIWAMSSFVHPLFGNPTLWANASKIVAIFGTVCISFLGMRLWVFVKPGVAIDAEEN